MTITGINVPYDADVTTIISDSFLILWGELIFCCVFQCGFLMTHVLHDMGTNSACVLSAFDTSASSSVVHTKWGSDTFQGPGKSRYILFRERFSGGPPSETSKTTYCTVFSFFVESLVLILPLTGLFSFCNTKV